MPSSLLSSPSFLSQSFPLSIPSSLPFSLPLPLSLLPPFPLSLLNSFTNTATLLLSAIINGQAQYNFRELLVAPNSSRIQVECFGSGNHYWQTSNGSQVSTNSQDMLYQQKDPSRSVQVLHITSFSQDTIGVYTCVTNLTGTLLQQAVFITSCKFNYPDNVDLFQWYWLASEQLQVNDCKFTISLQWTITQW